MPEIVRLDKSKVRLLHHVGQLVLTPMLLTAQLGLLIWLAVIGAGWVASALVLIGKGVCRLISR